MRTLLEILVNRVERIEIIDARQHVEHEAKYDRANGFESLIVKICGHPG
jgi:hypothetical protein